MKIFLDTADIEEIRTVARWGILDGVTTNPTLYARSAAPTKRSSRRSADHARAGLGRGRRRGRRGDAEEGREFAKLAPNIVVKVAMSENGLEAISRFADEGIKTNCTLIFTANQGLLAAKAGAS